MQECSGGHPEWHIKGDVLELLNGDCIFWTEYDQKIQPYEYGEKYSKATCLWLKGLLALKSTQLVEVYEPFCPSNTSAFSKGAKGSPGAAHTQKHRSKTFIGIAQAMADQWS